MLRGLDQLTLPAPWVRGVLVLIFLGFGVLVGNASESSSSATSPQAHLKLLLPATVASTSPPATSSAPAVPAATQTPTTPAAEAGSTGASSSGAGGQTSGGKGSSGGSGSGSGGSGSGGSGSNGSSGSGGAAGSGGGGGAGEGSVGSNGSGKLPAVKHVFLILLASQPYAAVFGPESKATYLAHTLEKRGELLVRYYAVAHDELANGIALLSGQGPTAQTARQLPHLRRARPRYDDQRRAGARAAAASTPPRPKRLRGSYLPSTSSGGPMWKGWPAAARTPRWALPTPPWARLRRLRAPRARRRPDGPRQPGRGGRAIHDLPQPLHVLLQHHRLPLGVRRQRCRARPAGQLT